MAPDGDDRPPSPTAVTVGGTEPALTGSTAGQHSVTDPATDPVTEQPYRFRLGNRPPLTGIRALALFTVLTYHSNFKTLPGTWAAIQVFFVLSGFLITAMLAGEGMRNGKISLKGFYARRGVRLLPPLVLTIALLGIYAHFVHVANASQRIWGDSLATMFYYADYRQAFLHAPVLRLPGPDLVAVGGGAVLHPLVAPDGGGGGGGAGATWPTGSWPSAWPCPPPTGCGRSTASTTSTPRTTPPSPVYYAFDTRADALFLGCLLGLLAADGYLHQWRPWALRILSASALVSTVFMVWILLYAPLFTENLVVWWLPLTTIASAVILVYFVMKPEAIASRLVGLGVLVFIGDLSYTVYLVHFPVFLAINPAGTGWGFWPTELVRLAIIFAIAVASWFLVEKPLMRWRQQSASKALGPTRAEP